MVRALLLMLTAGALWADERTERLMARLGEEAEAFGRLAPQVLGREELHQRAIREARGFRIGRAATEPQWQERTIVSEYTFAEIGGALHELRQVLSVDGKAVKNSSGAAERLAAVVTASDEKRKRELLEQFEGYGLSGAATDFGQFILMFTHDSQLRFDFSYAGRRAHNGEAVLAFSYRQIDGPNPLTVVDASRERTRSFSIQGEILVREINYRPVFFTVDATQTLGGDGIRQTAEIAYEMSPYGALLPTEVHHRDFRGETAVAENVFRYADFRRFGASSEITFDPEPAPAAAKSK